jgi:putative ABC transport system ATP-binding protein
VNERTLSAGAVRVRRADRWILDGISMTAGSGAICGVTGPSGSGKSTLLFVLGSLIRPDEGEVTFDGVPIAKSANDYTNRCAMVFQTYGLAHSLTAEENIAVPLQSRGLSRAEIAKRTERVITAIGLDGLGHHLIDELSGGQQQRVAMARALALEPEVLLADEPTSELDAETRKLVLGLLLDSVDRGVIVVMATHDPEVIAACDTVVELADGKIAGTRQVIPPRPTYPSVAPDLSDFARPGAEPSVGVAVEADHEVSVDRSSFARPVAEQPAPTSAVVAGEDKTTGPVRVPHGAAVPEPADAAAPLPDDSAESARDLSIFARPVAEAPDAPTSGTQ